MKRILIILSALLTSVSSAMADGINVGNVSLKKGGTATLSFELVNTVNDYSGVQFMIELADGLSFEVNKKGKIIVTKGDRLEDEDFTLSVAAQGNNKYKVLGYYTDGSSIPEQGGELFSLQLKADANMSRGDIACKVSEILLSTPDEQGVESADVSFTVSITSLTVIAKDNSRAYGEANPTFDYTVEGGTISGTPSITCEANATSPVGTYPIVISQGSITTEGAEYVNGTLTVNKAPLTITADNLTMTQGDQMPTFTAQYSGFKNNETSAVLSKQPVFSCSATSESAPGEYPITVSGAEAQNYNISYVAGKLTIVKRKFTVTATSANTEQGTVAITPASNDGQYEEGTNITVTATAKEGYHFVKWSDETTANPYSFSLSANVSLTAQFAPNQYTMTFKLDNGQADVVKTQDYKSALTAPANPTKVGYTFKGWSPVVPSTVPAQNMTFTAQWEINQYTVTWKLENGQVDIVQTLDYGSAITKPANPVKEGFTFKGWTPDVQATVPAENLVYTAQWERNKYVVKFVVDGQTVKEEEVLFEDAITKPTEPTKEGHTFKGWTPAVPAKMPAQAMTFTAQWQLNQYTVTWKQENGQADIVQTLDYGSAITKPADPVKEGFTFKGWTPDVQSTVPAENLVYTAQWERNSYTVKFVVDGQTAKEEELLFEATINKPADPEKEGYTFKGWTPAVPEKMPAQDMTFTAEWTVNEYALIYIVNSQEWARDMVAYGETLQLRSYNAPNGYVFNGWIFTDGNDYQTMPAHDVTVTADITTGISSVVTDGKAFDVYDLKGRKVRTQATSLEGLPKGAYIINGRKVVK